MLELHGKEDFYLNFPQHSRDDLNVIKLGIVYTFNPQLLAKKKLKPPSGFSLWGKQYRYLTHKLPLATSRRSVQSSV